MYATLSNGSAVKSTFDFVRIIITCMLLGVKLGNKGKEGTMYENLIL